MAYPPGIGDRSRENALGTALMAVVAAVFLSPASLAQCETAKLLASDPSAQDRFASAVDVFDDTAIIGSPFDDDRATDAGAVYFSGFDGVSWIERQKIAIVGLNEFDEFGVSVSIHRGLAIVGAWLDDEKGEDAGAAYVLRRAGDFWIPEQKLTASDGAAGDLFGNDVAIENDVAVVGSVSDDDAGLGSGAAYVFRFVDGSWTQERKLRGSDNDPGDQFGISVGLCGNAIAIGAPGTDDNGSESGSAYVFRFSGGTWAQEQKLLPADGSVFDFFGNDVDISGDRVVAGAIFDDPQGLDSGAAYVFRFDDSVWIEEQKLRHENGNSRDRFGADVSISGEVVLAGAPLQDSRGPDAGAAYVFRHDGVMWNQVVRLTASDGDPGDEFGAAVAARGDVGIVGAALDEQAAPQAGSAYVAIGLVGTDCNENGASDSCDIADGTSDDEEGDGIPDECQCPEDVNDSGVVDFADLLRLIAAWGPCPDCDEDLDQNGVVDFADIVIVLAVWGICEDL